MCTFNVNYEYVTVHYTDNSHVENSISIDIYIDMYQHM